VELPKAATSSSLSNRSKADIPPVYMVEVFTKPNLDSEAAKQYIFEKLGWFQ
jgi:hypothetical protein